MATHSGREGTVKFSTNSIAEITGFTIDVTADLIEDTELADAAKTFLPNRYGWTANAECHWDETDTNGQLAAETALLAGTTVTLNLYPEGASSTDKYISGTAYINSMSIAVSEGATIKRTISFTGTGAVSLTSSVA